MRAPEARFVLPLALCVGALALAGCPKMPRVSALDPNPSPTATLSPSTTPSTSPSPAESPPASDEPILRELVVGSAPRAIAMDATGNGYVTLPTDIVKITKATGTMSEATLLNLSTVPFEFGSPSSIMLAGEAVWFTDDQRKQLREIKAGSSGQTEDFPFGSLPSRMALDIQGNVFVADATGRQVGALPAGSLAGKALFTAATVGQPVDILVDVGGSVWTLGADDGDLTKISRTIPGNTLEGLEVLPNIPPLDLTQGKGIAQDDGGNLWVTGLKASGGQLVKVDRGSGSPIATFNLGFVPGRIAVRGNFAWIPDDSPSGTMITKVSLTDGSVVATYPLGGRASDVFKDAGGDLWIPVVTSNTIVKLDF